MRGSCLPDKEDWSGQLIKHITVYFLLLFKLMHTFHCQYVHTVLTFKTSLVFKCKLTGRLVCAADKVFRLKHVLHVRTYIHTYIYILIVHQPLFVPLTLCINQVPVTELSIYSLYLYILMCLSNILYFQTNWVFQSLENLLLWDWNVLVIDARHKLGLYSYGGNSSD